MLRIVSTALAAVLLSSGAVVFDFEDPAAGATVNAISGGGINATVTTISNRAGGSNQAVIFDSAHPTGNDSDLAAPFGPGPGVSGQLSPGNILIIAGPDNGQGLPDDDAQGGTITFDFDQEVNVFGFDFFDLEEEISELVVTTGSGFASSMLVTGDGQYGSFSTPILGVQSLSFDFAGSGAIDNLNVSAVPLPAAPPLLLAALGGLAFVGRRRAAMA